MYSFVSLVQKYFSWARIQMLPADKPNLFVVKVIIA